MTEIAGAAALVTGGSGFIGEHLCRRLADMGAQVHSVGRHTSPHLPDGVRQWNCDATQLDGYQAVWRTCRPDLVFHLASMVTGSRDRSVVLPTLRANLEAAVNTYLLASEFGCKRVVVTGSMEEPIPQTDEIPGSPYAAAKAAATHYARMFHLLYKLPVAVLRVFMVYGPRQRDVRKLVPYVVRSFERGETPKLSSGERMVDWIYVDDVVDAFVAAAVAPDIAGSVVDVGSGDLVSIREIVERIAKLTGARVSPAYGALADRVAERPRSADIETAHSLMQWAPKTSLDEGLKRTVEWYRNTLNEATSEQNS